MSTLRATAVLFGHDYRLAGGFLGLGVVVGGLLATDLLHLSPSPHPTNLLVGMVALVLVAIYAYWNDGLAACWLFVCSIVFGRTYYTYTDWAGDVGYSASLRHALFFGVFITAFAGPLAFVLGSGARDILERAAIPERLRPGSTVPLRVVLLGRSPRTSSTPLFIGITGAVLLGGGMALAGDPFSQDPPRILGNPLFLMGILIFAAAVEWRYRGVLLACGATFLALLGLFVGGMVGPVGVIEAVRGGVWNALLMTLTVGLPGTIVATLPQLRPSHSETPAVGGETGGE